MLDKKQMMKAFRDKKVEGPKHGVTKRKPTKSDAAATDSVRSGSGSERRSKKLKRTLEPYLQDVLDGKGVANLPVTEEILSSDEEANSPPKTGEGQPIDIATGEENLASPKYAEETWPGVKSVAGGFRDPIRQPTEPQGELDWSTLDIRTHWGWTGEGPRPLDILRAFNISVDLQYYRDLGPREFNRELRLKAGEFMSALVGNSEWYKDMRAMMKSERRKAGKAATDLKMTEA